MAGSFGAAPNGMLPVSTPLFSGTGAADGAVAASALTASSAVLGASTAAAVSGATGLPVALPPGQLMRIAPCVPRSACSSSGGSFVTSGGMA